MIFCCKIAQFRSETKFCFIMVSWLKHSFAKNIEKICDTFLRKSSLIIIDLCLQNVNEKKWSPIKSHDKRSLSKGTPTQTDAEWTYLNWYGCQCGKHVGVGWAVMACLMFLAGL